MKAATELRSPTSSLCCRASLNCFKQLSTNFCFLGKSSAFHAKIMSTRSFISSSKVRGKKLSSLLKIETFKHNKTQPFQKSHLLEKNSNNLILFFLNCFLCRNDHKLVRLFYHFNLV